jgi:hypothetical protein
VKVVLNNIALVIGKCDDDDQCAWRRMCMNITYSLNCCSLIISSTKVHDYYFASLYYE